MEYTNCYLKYFIVAQGLVAGLWSSLSGMGRFISRLVIKIKLSWMFFCWFWFYKRKDLYKDFEVLQMDGWTI